MDRLTPTQKLVEAMHEAGASLSRTCGDWLELAQQHKPLLDAMHKIFGKRLPTPSKFGLWLSERTGQSFGDFLLQGQHSSRRKCWIYRIASLNALAEQKQEAERQYQEMTASLQIAVQPGVDEECQETARIERKDIALDIESVPAQKPVRMPARQPADDGSRTPKVFVGGKWREMSPHELAAHEQASQSAPAGAHSDSWFVHACSVRNGRFSER